MSFTDLVPWGRSQRRGALTPRETEYDPFTYLQRRMNRLFDDTLGGFNEPVTFAERALTGQWPAIDVLAADKEVRVTADLPGLEEKDVEITFNDGVLTIRGEKKAEVDDRERAFTERFYGKFERRIALGRDVDDTRAEATFANGVLTIVLPKAPDAQQQQRRIPINASRKQH